MLEIPTLEDVRAACSGSTHTKARDCFQILLSSIIEPIAPEVQSEAKQRVLQIQDILKENKGIKDVFMDVVWLETSMMESASDFPQSLVEVLHTLTESIPDLRNQFLEFLDPNLLQKLGIIPSESELQKKIRLTNTQQYYRQHKFNLMVEESEGFSKLLQTIYVLLNREDLSAGDESSAVVGIVGTFSLDPNRCLDILLDILELELEAVKQGNKFLEENPKLDRLLTFVNALSLDKLPALLAFKLSKAKIPDNVLRTAAFLVLRKTLKLAEFLTFLPEWPDVLQSMFDSARKQERDEVRAMGRVRLSSKKTDEKPKAVDLSSLYNHPTTQIVLLLLGWNQFETVEELFRPYWSMLCVLFPKTFGSAICDTVAEKLEPLYKQAYEVTKSAPLSTGGSDHDSAAVLPTMDELLSSVAEKLEYTMESGCIGQSPALYSKLCFVVTEVIKKESASKECIKFLRNFLMPCSSLFENQPDISDEVWKIVERFPYETRYSLYSSWRGPGLERDALLSDKPLWLVRGEITAGKGARHALKRLSKDTIRDACRALAKVSHAHPLVIFSTILSQIESYDNLVQVMVDALQFVTLLSLDVLGFCILGRLNGTTGGVNRSRLKDDGVNVSQWLQSLESFIGALYKHFPFLELGGIMSYLMGRVSSGHVMELGVLRTLLKEAGGWAFADYAPAASLSSTQLEGRAGSTLLKRETMSFGVVQRIHEKASASVRRVLLNDDIGVKLLVLLSQIPHQIIFDTKSKPPKPVKLIANLVDTCQVTTALLLDFLTDANPNDMSRFAKSLPTLAALHSEYELDVASAWMLARPLVRAASSPSSKRDEPVDASKESCESMLPESVWVYFSWELFKAFYANTLSDIFCPEDVYKSEIDRLNKEEERLNRRKASLMSQVVIPGRPNAEPDDGAAERAKRHATWIAEDFVEQKKRVSHIRGAIESMSKRFFVPGKNISEAATLFFSHCVYPRCMQGPDDAMYCVQFILLLHRLEVPGFSTMHLFDVLIVASSRSLFGLTEGEAANVSILFTEIWKVLSKWRYEEDHFNSELAGKPGSNMVDENGDVESISRDGFTALYNKWHAVIGSTALGCLHSKEYIHARNALIVLTRMVEVYPTRPRLANKLLTDLVPMQDESFPFADLRASAQAYSTQLMKARDEGVWKEESAEAVKARLAKEQAAAAARQKKAEEQMEQIKRDSEKITKEIGEKESWGRGDRDRRGPYRSGPQDEIRRGQAPYRSGPQDEGRRGQSSTVPTDPRAPNTPTKDRGGEAWNTNRDRGGPSRNDPTASSAVARRDQGPDDTSRRAPLDGRWQKGGAGSDRAAAKRSRPNSPADPGEIQEDVGPRNKRSRHDNADDDVGRKGGSGYRRRGRNN